MAHRPTPEAPPRRQRKRARTSKPDRETLRRMYEDEHLTQRQIAAKLGAAHSSVRKWMAEECIQGRIGKQAHIASAEDLRRMYHDEGLLQPEIAERLGVAVGTVRRWMADAGIETRHGGGRSEAGRKAKPQPEAEPQHRGLRGTFRRLSEVERGIVQKKVDDFLIYAAMQREESEL